MSVLQSHFQGEKEKNSVVEVSRLLISIHDILVESQAQKSMSLEVNALLKKSAEVLMQVVTNSVRK
jgi:hypothetical protein